MNQPLPGIVWIQFLLGLAAPGGASGRTRCRWSRRHLLRARVAAHRRERLAAAQDRTAVCVVGDDRPEVLHRDVRRYVQPVALAAVEEGAAPIARRPQVLRAGANMLLDHRRRHADRDVGEAGAAVGVDVALRVPVGRAADEGPFPRTVRVDEASRVVGVEAVGAGNRRAQRAASSSSAFRAASGANGLPFSMPMAASWKRSCEAILSCGSRSIIQARSAKY